MKAIIVYTSLAHGNTEKIARAMAETLPADMVPVEKIKARQLLDYDLIGLGSGIYHYGFHKKLIQFSLDLSKFAHPPVFVFSTSGLGNTGQNKSFTRHLSDLGFPVIGSFACKGLDDYGIKKLFGGIAQGRPNADDLQSAREFAEKMGSWRTAPSPQLARALAEGSRAG